jgi:hypothetical protein
MKGHKMAYRVPAQIFRPPPAPRHATALAAKTASATDASAT